MGVSQRPAQWNVYRPVTHERGTIISSGGYTVLNGNVTGVRHLDEARDRFVRRDIRTVDGTDDEAIAQALDQLYSRRRSR